MGWSTSSREPEVKANILGMKKGETKLSFKISKRDGNEETILTSDARAIDGKLIKVEAGSYQYQDNGKTKTSQTLTFYLNDGTQVIKLGTGYNHASRQFIYCLASLDKIETVELSLYVSKTGNKNGRVKNNGQDVMSKFDFETEIKGRSKPILDGAGELVKMDYTELDDWIRETLIPKINKACAGNSIEGIIAQDTAEKSPLGEEDDEEIPF